jgi:adenylosuccinate synthase
MVLVRYACMVNGATELAITNLDGLDGLDEVGICTAYELDGRTIHYPPSTIEEIERCKPIYETHPGWLQDLSGAKSFDDLPPKAHAYLDRVAELARTPIKLLGIGPSREQTLRRG